MIVVQTTRLVGLQTIISKTSSSSYIETIQTYATPQGRQDIRRHSLYDLAGWVAFL